MAPDLTKPKPSGRFYRPELDALRFVAFMGVFVDHGIPLHGWGTGPVAAFWRVVKGAGQAGVCIFFLLSAYLIMELLRREFEATGTANLKAFYVRRILRIWPLYFGVVYVTALMGLHFHKLHIEIGRVLALTFLVGNWYAASHRSTAAPILAALWSISVEEQFYLVWPALARFGPQSLLRWVSIALIPTGWAAASLYVWFGLGDHVWSSTIVQFQFFAAGTLLAIYLRGRVMEWRALARCTTFVVGMIGLVLGGWLLHSGVPSPWGAAAAAGAAFVSLLSGSVLLLLSVLGVNADWLPDIIIYLGKISFGLYVFHQFGFMFSHFVTSKLFRGWMDDPQRCGLASILLYWTIALIFTAVVAHLSYRYYELRFLRLKKRFEVVKSRTA